MNKISDETITKAILAADNLSAYTLKNLSAYTLNNLSADTLNNLSAYTLNNLSAYTLNNLSADTLKNLSAYTLNNLSADTLKNLSELKSLIEAIPVLEKPYTQLFTDIKEKRRTHDQKTFGKIEDFDANLNVCGMAMCTGGHLVNMCGAAGYALKNKIGWEGAAKIIHHKAHPNYPNQNYGSIGQDLAMAFIEGAAYYEETGINIFEAKI